jgi:hypothetical protein
MAEIDASNGLTIAYDSGRWALNNGRERDERKSTIASASAQSDGLSYQPAFALARRLPDGGQLPAAHIASVVVGWAVEDSSWHLGLLLTPEAAAVRGGRWCGLARWEDQDGDLAERAGEGLARVLGKPFRYVPPPDHPGAGIARQPELADAHDAQSIAAPNAPPPVMPLSLPIQMGDWVLADDEVGIKLQPTPDWARSLLLRGLFFGALTPIFGFLSVGALLSNYAAVQPEWLPLMGLALTVIMLGAAIAQFVALARGPVVVIDRRARLVRKTARLGGRVLVQSPFEGLQHVLVSHVVNRRRARKSQSEGAGVPGYTTVEFWGEMWIHAFSPRRGFIELCHVGDAEGQMQAQLDFSSERPLDLREVSSPVHHAAVRIAAEIGVPAYIEQR